MSKHKEPTVLSVVDRALGNEERTARLQTLIITTTKCIVAVGVVLFAVLALSGGHFELSVGLGAIVSVRIIWKRFKKAFPVLRKSL